MRIADGGIVNGRVEATSDAWSAVWEEWKDVCGSFRNVHPHLDGADFTTRVRVATTFAGKVRAGKRGKAVGAGHVRAALGGVAAKIAMDTGERPLHQAGRDGYIAPSSTC